MHHCCRKVLSTMDHKGQQLNRSGVRFLLGYRCSYIQQQWGQLEGPLSSVSKTGSQAVMRLPRQQVTVVGGDKLDTGRSLPAACWRSPSCLARRAAAEPMLGLELALVGRAMAAFFSFLFCSASPLALMACSTTIL